MLDLANELSAAFPKAFQAQASLARYTSARIGGPAEFLLTARSATDLEAFASWLWERDQHFVLLGGGSNVLVSDYGIRGVTILNQARAQAFEVDGQQCLVKAEAGASLGAIARQAAQQGFSGLEWAAGVPGTLGGALVGNAGAHGGDMSGVLRLATILHREKGRQALGRDDLKFEYRSSYLKELAGQAVVLSVEMELRKREASEIQKDMDEYLQHRRQTQPPGASMGSMFKNPRNDYAGRLIEAAGLKGRRVGNAQISDLHGNFFVNLGDARAEDVLTLIQEAREAVERTSGLRLELEIGLLGEWPDTTL